MRYSFLLFILLVLGCGPKHDLPVVLELHDNWEFRQLGDSLWQSANVPGNVFTDLLNHGLIDDPFVGTNEEGIQWVSETDWEYRTRFQLSEELLAKKHVEINFEGLDTYASVYLNDSLILSANNAFRAWRMPVKPLLNVENELRINFTSPAKTESIEKAKLAYELPEGNRVFTRKAQFQYGWDWGPKLNIMGVWRPVKLIFTNDFRFGQLTIRNEKVSDSLAALKLGWHTTGSYDADRSYELYLNKRLVQTMTERDVQSKGLTLFIENPKLWWPHNIGEPYLYDIKLVAKKGDRILDSIKTTYGIRDVKLVTEPDSLGESFYFKVNGIPVYAKGANYIPQNSFQNRVTRSDYEQLLQDVVDANMNMLRVWGGGIYENDEFYQLCDEKGIMLWQDFMFACAMYPGDKDFLSNVKQEAIDNMARLRNHPSIVLWCGNNENSEGWYRWGWQEGRSESEKEEIWASYLKLFDSLLPEMVDAFTDVPYWESSPKYGRGNPKYQFEGDAHDWWVWHDGYPFEHFETEVPRFMSEFGFQSFPSAEIIQLINESDSLDLTTEAVQNHQKHSRGFELIREYMARDFPLVEDPEHYIYMSQLVQAYGITKGIEAHRRARPYNMGSLYWQLNDCWPAISWSSIDFKGRWKALHYKAKHSFENVLISPQINGDKKLEVWLVNDGLKNHTGMLELKVLNFMGESLWAMSRPIRVYPNSSSMPLLVDLEEIASARDSVVLQVSFNEYSRLFYFEQPKDIRLIKGEISTEIMKSTGGFDIELSSPVLQKDVFLSTALEGRFSDNFFDLLPNRPKIVHFQTEEENIPELQMISFNNFIREVER